MSDAILLQIARDCQKWGAFLAPAQNSRGLPVRPGLVGRFFRWLFGRTRPPYELPPEVITEVVNALISGGNALEYVVREHVKERSNGGR